MTTHTYRPPIVRFTPADFFRALRQEANRGPAYVRRQAQRLLNRILGPTPGNWAPRPPQLPDLSLSPAQRRWFHLHPVPLLLALPVADESFPAEEGEPEPADNPL